MSGPIEFELAFLGWSADYYRLEATLQVDENERNPPEGLPLQIPFEDLRQHTLDPAEYGRRLTRAVFADERVKQLFATALASSQREGVPLRLRLRIDRSAPQLHTLLWETLRDPEDDNLLATNENIYFSRFIARRDFRSVRASRKGLLRAFVAVAAPSDLGGSPGQWNFS